MVVIWYKGKHKHLTMGRSRAVVTTSGHRQRDMLLSIDTIMIVVSVFPLKASNRYKIQLEGLEDQLLQRLADAPADILADVGLIEVWRATCLLLSSPGHELSHLLLLMYLSTMLPLALVRDFLRASVRSSSFNCTHHPLLQSLA